MSYLPIILIVIFLLNRNSGVKEVLQNFDFQSISPLLSLFGVNDKVIETMQSPEMKNVINGNIDIKTIMPLLTTLISSVKETSPKESTQEKQYQPEYLNPIKDVASEEVFSTLSNYFEH